ncbi:LysE family translocator [Agrobacterium sp. SHOUNA12C]|uniref:Amino acid efflux protein n=2 Tax=Rhizobium rhizogenes TaxID=359 RepID=B9JGJ7_RHIR8|nr:LysE family translocator [Rhizobium rhizogenes]ACM26971.1 amino acid efflux protein [Rhizobium rhizogenes K84]KAA6489994.1 LysE family translocator [Agrobacterium sp. ICMP 7243]MCJ9720168.1 LysE family translocator [Agrobacterium sp. BETTINA12B]MCJ9755557.1 LysE family translocator [Agrobacterium sp. SHOUNA12C]OCJ05759.1 lysine transporter LysE [Agrobacterium sp. 13-626]OCJ26034.1 lysine transporter LysE [Agrobacterium sp. B131/95]OCJ30868.1 lysine transporter LysE [Agrobacterium sp. B133
MALDTFLALLVFAFTTSITPGPNNMMLFASGVNFGFRRTIPHMLGIGVGFFVLLLGVGLGLGALLHTVPLLYTVLKFAGGAYLVWIAWKIATSRSIAEKESGAQPMSFLSAAAFQWVNPKAWVMAVTAMATYTNPELYLISVVIVGLAFAAVNVPSVSTWAGFGSALRDWLSDPVRLKWFNITMAVLLVLSLWPMLK